MGINLVAVLTLFTDLGINICAMEWTNILDDYITTLRFIYSVGTFKKSTAPLADYSNNTSL